MLTIALNEYGDFHHLGQDEESLKMIHFIAGIVYDDMDNAQDAINERIRLDRFFRAVAKDSRSLYPQGFFGKLKSDETEEGKGREKFNSNAKKDMRIFRDAIDAALPKFLAHGTYNGEELVAMPRVGHYAIALTLKSEAGKTEYLQPSMSNLLHDKVASNLYWHMADSLVSRLVFTNPFAFGVQRVRLELATQMIDVLDSERERLIEYSQLGYTPYEYQDEHLKKERITSYQVANAFAYRASLDRHMVESNRPDLDVKLRTVSLRMEEDDPESTIRNAFLYLATYICTNFIYYGADREANDVFKFKKLVDFSNKLNPTHQNLLFVYDNVDTYFEKAMQSYLNGDYFDALCYTYDAYNCESRFQSYYKINWFPFLEELIHSADDRVAIERAVQDFVNYANQSRIDAGKLHYVYDQLKYVLEDIQHLYLVDQRLVYAFYDGGVTAFNHLGESDFAVSCFQKCQSLAHTVPLETYMQTVCRRVVAKLDSYDYDDALILANYVVAYEEQIQGLREKLSMDEKAISLGQAYSQLGQVYAYLKREEAESYFVKALSIFQEGTSDYYRTLSYLLHYYIDAEKQRDYETWAPKYFGGAVKVSEQLTYIISMTDDDKVVQHESYALYVYIKALYEFYKHAVGKDVIKRIVALGKEVAQTLNYSVKGHPWELIFIYMSLLGYDWNYMTDVEYFKDCIRKTVDNPGPAIRNIMVYGEMRIAERNGNQKLYDAIRITLQRDIENIERAMTYMFR
jgi:hypothetical protein